MAEPSSPGDAGPRVVVLGAAGYFGRLLVEDLVRTTRAPIVTVGRGVRRLDRLRREVDPAGRRIAAEVADVADPARLAAIVRGGDIVVDCAGPFQTRGLEALDTAVSAGAHYVDIADARGYLAAVHARRGEWERSQGVVLSGASAVPGLIVQLARHAAALLDRVDAVSTWMAPGNRDPRRHGTVYSLLDGLCDLFPVLRGGRIVPVRPWSEPEVVHFPFPIGDRAGYLMSGVDSDIVPLYFPAVRTCELRVGAEIGLLNVAVAALVPLARLAPRAFRAAVPLFRLLMAAFGWLGTSAGGMLVRVDGLRDGAPSRVTVAITRATDGPIIAIVPASLAVAKLLDGTLRPPRGWVPLDGWLSHEELVAGFRARGCEVTESISPERDGES